MTEQTLYYCGQPKPNEEQWWVLLSPENVQLVCALAVMTGKPIEWLVNMAFPEYYEMVEDNPLLWNMSIWDTGS